MYFIEIIILEMLNLQATIVSWCQFCFYTHYVNSYLFIFYFKFKHLYLGNSVIV